MLIVRLAGVWEIAVWEIAVHLVVAGDVFDGVFLCCPFSHYIGVGRGGARGARPPNNLRGGGGATYPLAPTPPPQ